MEFLLFGIVMVAYIVYSEVKHAKRIRRWRTGKNPFIVRGDRPLGRPED